MSANHAAAFYLTRRRYLLSEMGRLFLPGANMILTKLAWQRLLPRRFPKSFVFVIGLLNESPHLSD